MTRTPIIDVAAAGVLLLLTLSAYGFWYRSVSSKSAEAASIRAELNQKGEAGSRAVSARRTLEEIGRSETEVYRHFVSSDDVVPFLEGLETTGRTLGAQVEVVSVANALGKQGAINLSLRISGSFDAVMRTLGAIEYQPYDTTLVSLALDTPPGNSAWTGAAVFLVGTTPQAASSTATTTPKTP